MSRTRWLILLLGPLPIAVLSWAVSSWFRSPPLVVAQNTVLAAPTRSGPASPGGTVFDDSWTGGAELERQCDQTAERLVRDLGAECGVVVRVPFVLAGDLSPEALVAWHDGTIAPAVRAMHARYFRRLPNSPVTVLLLRGEQSYNRYSKELFGDAGISVYGYYKPHLRTLVLNVETGSGTLLHELTHALMDFNLPDAPDWLNEGLASLHEQCRFRHDDRGPWLEGLVNWRLAGLQEVQRQGRLRSLESLFQDGDFRGPLAGANYAQARYFFLYMQQQGVLESFLRRYERTRRHDPTGTAAVLAAFAGGDLAELDRDFQDWVRGVEPPGQSP